MSGLHEQFLQCKIIQVAKADQALWIRSFNSKDVIGDTQDEESLMTGNEGTIMTDEQFNNAMERLRGTGKGNPEETAVRKQALKEIYEEYSGFIYHVILNMTGSRETAEDITSDFFIRLWEKAGQYKEGHGHRGYLATIARNMAIDHLRKYSREQLQAGQDEQDEARDDIGQAAAGEPSPEDSTVSQLSVEQALDRLKPVYRQIVTMKVLGEMTFAEIAKAMDMPMGTVTWNYREAIKQLRRFGYDE